MEVVVWLQKWMPTIWYTTGFLAFWCGSGVLVFRTVMRAFVSSGRQRIAAESSEYKRSISLQESFADEVTWTFSKVWIFPIAAILGPIGSFVFAILYHYIPKALRSLVVGLLRWRVRVMTLDDLAIEMTICEKKRIHPPIHRFKLLRNSTWTSRREDVARQELQRRTGA